MKTARASLTLKSVLTVTLALLPTVAQAQIVPDTSLPVNSIVAPNGNVFTIDGGTQAGGNLFHSFQDFSLPTGTEAFFNNAANVQNIFSRVTGGNISNIDGLIRANGGANLFLLNPAGIVFGPNARLDIGGSFFGTTAEGIHFADGTEFSATDPNTSPLLTISVPIGVQFGSNSGGIIVRGTGHRITIGTLFTPLDLSNNPIGLQVKAGQTLALWGSGVNFSGGIATASGGGHLEVGSISQGRVSLSPTELGGFGNYTAVQQFNDIHLAQQSLLDASGSGGSIQVQGRNIDFTEGSAALIHNFGAQPSRGITIRATESLNLTGNNLDGRLGSLIESENLGMGQTGDITISAAQLSLKEGGGIWNVAYTEANSGNLTVTVDGALEVEGAAPGGLAIPSSILTLSANSGNGGDLTVSADTIGLLNAGQISSILLDSGQVGTLRVEAKEQIEIAGNNPITAIPSSINAGVFGSGNANPTFINTSRLIVRDGGVIGSNTFAAGAASSVTIRASESVEVTGRAARAIGSSRIASTAEHLEPLTQAALGLPPLIPSGDSGSLTIDTPSLRVTDEALVSVRNDGLGRAGDVRVRANSIVLDNGGAIAASTASGNGGNLTLNVQEHLQMRNGSLISATAAGTGNGGSISIDTPVLVGLENSDIIANAVQGTGGNISIATQGILGLENRSQLTDESDITASSQFGVDGDITITNPEVDPSNSLVNFSSEVVDPSEQVATGCQWTADSEFVATGRGGVPTNPNRPLRTSRTWSDVRDLSEFRGETVEGASGPADPPPALVEATGWVVRDDGVMELVATAAPSPSGNFAASGCNPLENRVE